MAIIMEMGERNFKKAKRGLTVPAQRKKATELADKYNLNYEAVHAYLGD
jgi:hypothetical protein